MWQISSMILCCCNWGVFYLLKKLTRSEKGSANIKYKHKIRLKMCVGRILSVGKVDTWQVSVGGDRLCLTSWQEVWEGAEKLAKNILIYLFDLVSESVLPPLWTRSVKVRTKAGRTPKNDQFCCKLKYGQLDIFWSLIGPTHGCNGWMDLLVSTGTFAHIIETISWTERNKTRKFKWYGREKCTQV